MDRKDWIRSQRGVMGRGIVMVAISVLAIGCSFPRSAGSNCLLKGNDTIGSMPADWVVAETNGNGTPAVWGVVADTTAVDGAKAVAITRTENSGRTYNMLVQQILSFSDLSFTVKVKAISGKEDQGGGPVWRYQDSNNYYIARWNPLETNFRLYYVKDSKRVQLASVDVQADPKAWHSISIDHQGNRIKASLDGRQLIDVTDDAIAKAGKIGLWTKADAATAFDALQIFSSNH
jgi:hypothetical protein